MQFDKIENIEMGLVGYLEDQEYAVGNQALMEKQGVDISNIMDDLTSVLSTGVTTVLVSEQKLMGWIEMKDELRETTILAISKAKKLGLKVIMLTGDRAETSSLYPKSRSI